MRKSARLWWWRHAVVTGALIGCASTQKGETKKPEPPQLTQWVNFVPGFRLSAVERPRDATQRYGAQSISKQDSLGVNRWIFEDQLVRVLWLVNGETMLFSLRNKSEYSIRVIWDQAAFVDFSGSSHPVMHVGTRYSECTGTKTPSVIVRAASIEDQVIGCNRVRRGVSDWVVDPLIDTDRFPMPEADSSESKLKRTHAGKKASILLPLQIEGIVNDYLFTFEFDGFTRRPCLATNVLFEGKPLICI